MLDDLDVLAESSENICVRFIWFSPFFVCFLHWGKVFNNIRLCLFEWDWYWRGLPLSRTSKTHFVPFFFPRNHSRSLVFTEKIGDICCVLKAVKRGGLSCAKSGNKGSPPYPCCPKCSFSQCVFIIWGYFQIPTRQIRQLGYFWVKA